MSPKVHQASDLDAEKVAADLGHPVARPLSVDANNVSGTSSAILVEIQLSEYRDPQKFLLSASAATYLSRALSAAVQEHLDDMPETE